MKNKLIYLIIAIAILMMLLTACKASFDYDKGSSPGDYNADLAEAGDGEEIVAAERKIIYSVYTTIHTDNFSEAVNKIQESLVVGEWMDYETISDSYARFVARVKSDRIDEFITNISEDNSVRQYEKTSRDVSLNYQDKEAQITALEAERARLIELYEDANVEEMILINTRLSMIALEINTLQGTLNRYDSLVDYSEITIVLYERSAAPTPLTFGTRLGKTFMGAWAALGAFFAGIVIALTAIFPFAVVLGPIGVGIFFLVRLINTKRKDKIITPPKDTKKNTEDTKE